MALQHIQQANPPLPRSKRALGRFAHHLGEFLLEHWATIVTVILGVLVGIAIAVPFLSYFGLDAIAKPLFFALHYVCAQVPSHSFYIFGHQLGLCARNFSIYTAMFLGSLIFVLSKKRLPGLPWWLWILMILPMAWDGITQMFGLRESTWELRLLTGTLFGLGNIWFVLPMIQKSLDETPASQQMYFQPQMMTNDIAVRADQHISEEPQVGVGTASNTATPVEQEAEASKGSA
jgi:uncharacterized membrane protein